MQKYPKDIYKIGSLNLLKKEKISIVGSRRPSNYTKNYTYLLSLSLSKRGICIVSGGAMGVDTISHNGAGINNTIMVSASGLEIKYPAINNKLISDIQEKGLVLSQFSPSFKPTPWSFVVRNEIVVALGKILIVTEADENSGSMRSVDFALKMGKKIFVLPHSLNYSKGTNKLLKNGLAEAIYDIDEFADKFGKFQKKNIQNDKFFNFCKNCPTLEEAIKFFGDRVYEEEFNQNILIKNGFIYLII